MNSDVDSVNSYTILWMYDGDDGDDDDSGIEIRFGKLDRQYLLFSVMIPNLLFYWQNPHGYSKKNKNKRASSSNTGIECNEFTDWRNRAH